MTRSPRLHDAAQLYLPGIADPMDPVRRRFFELRARYPELRRELTWNGVKSLLRKLGIRLIYAPMPRTAAIISDGDMTVIMVNSNTPPRRHTYFVAHELAHYFLHVGEEPCFHMDTELDDSEREDDADFLALLMLGGPQFHRMI